MALLPTIPENPSVALSYSDRRFILARRAERVSELRQNRIETVLYTASGLFCFFAFLLSFGG